MLSEFDKNLLNVLQKGFPVCSRPFKDVAKQLGTSEKMILERICELKTKGYIRRVGAFFDSNNLGYQGTLIALKVKRSAIQMVVEEINKYSGVTHNYERDGEYNIWFTLLSSNDIEKDIIVKKIRSLNGVLDMLQLRTERKYKINVQFQL